mmetsp:Transcript_124643/g.216003  ORF Transcript_124643/g.216003 Transcript_124643/m.216003 type:complete len:223 (+) Transcript_124643:111-779(+)
MHCEPGQLSILVAHDEGSIEAFQIRLIPTQSQLTTSKVCPKRADASTSDREGAILCAMPLAQELVLPAPGSVATVRIVQHDCCSGPGIFKCRQLGISVTCKSVNTNGQRRRSVWQKPASCFAVAVSVEEGWHIARPACKLLCALLVFIRLRELIWILSLRREAQLQTLSKVSSVHPDCPHEMIKGLVLDKIVWIVAFRYLPSSPSCHAFLSPLCLLRTLPSG